MNGLTSVKQFFASKIVNKNIALEQNQQIPFGYK